ncbi:MAG: 50S ribosomal protein L18 [Phycisphaeraceae bacterium]|nr:MAG: 50S ribosomal protein L18 [Phycisphaeraceae bacterium]
MNSQKAKQMRRTRRQMRTRKRVRGTPERPRLCVYRSVHHIYVQVIDDLSGRTLASASTVDKACSASKPGNSTAAAEVGKLIAERAKSAGLSTVVFDRNGFQYHGRIKALAEAAREGGLQF